MVKVYPVIPWQGRLFCQSKKKPKTASPSAWLGNKIVAQKRKYVSGVQSLWRVDCTSLLLKRRGKGWGRKQELCYLWSLFTSLAWASTSLIVNTYEISLSLCFHIVLFKLSIHTSLKYRYFGIETLLLHCKYVPHVCLAQICLPAQCWL